MRHRLAALRWTLADALREAREHARELGAPAAATLAVSRLVGRTPQARPPLWPLRLPGYRHPVHYREGTSDALVLRQVLGGREYDCVSGEPAVRTIFDLGGNLGAASFHLLHAYPRATVVFVEPDADNLRVARRNLAPWAGQVTFVQAGVWDASVDLTVDRGYRDGAEWSIQVRPTRPGEAADLRGVTVNDLLRDCGAGTIDLVKMDIEAAEATVFRGDTAWPPSTTAAITSSSNPTAALDDPEPRRAAMIRPAQAEAMPVSTNTEAATLRAGMPTRRAASALAPTAMTCRP